MEKRQAPTSPQSFRAEKYYNPRTFTLMLPKVRYALLPLCIALLLVLVYLLPQTGSMIPSAVSMKLPANVAGWVFRAIPASKEEIDTLAADTEFSKAICLKARPGEFDLLYGNPMPDRIDLSIVLSGHDLNNSIHRPERCMPSQGHIINNTTDVVVTLDNGRKITVRRLLSVQSIPTNEERTEYKSFDCVTYYFFVGSHLTTHDHLDRTLLDMKDRLLLGLDQRWAYVSLSTWYGDLPWMQKKIPLEEADAKLKAFLQEFGALQIDWEKIR
jgi:hypothetical protein